MAIPYNVSGDEFPYLVEAHFRGLQLVTWEDIKRFIEVKNIHEVLPGCIAEEVSALLRQQNKPVLDPGYGTFLGVYRIAYSETPVRYSLDSVHVEVNGKVYSRFSINAPWTMNRDSESLDEVLEQISGWSCTIFADCMEAILPNVEIEYLQHLWLSKI